LGEDKLRFERWKDGEMLESWVSKDDYDPRTRPWYKNALEAEENQIVGTEPYIFYNSKKPGITVSTRWQKRDTGRRFITGIDIMLSNISRFTQAMRPTENGVVFVMTQDLRFLGLPADERFRDEKAVDAAMLKPINDVDLPVVQAAVAEWEQRGRTRREFPFKVNGASWWAGFELDENIPEKERFWGGILVPESDFLGTLAWQRNVALAAIAGVGLLLAAVLIVIAVRRIRRDIGKAVTDIGQKLGPFELVYKIGDVENGSVYRARHELLKRPTVVKVMRPEFARSKSAKERFIQEVQITSSLTHLNTLAVYDFGQTPDGSLYYAREYLNGVSLEDLVRITGPQAAPRVVHILHQTCGSLAEAHGSGLIHQDIKPAKIMLCVRGGLHDVVKVLEYGLIKDTRPEAPQPTQADTGAGTPLYMAPEIITGASDFSPSSDLYALGEVGYFLLTGRNVFEGGSAAEIRAMHQHDEPVPPSESLGWEIPADFETLLMSCLAKKPEDRPGSAQAMSEALARCDSFGAWTPQLAKQWWSENRRALPTEEPGKDRSPLPDTQLRVDMEARMQSNASPAREAKP
jgi:serine/threonine protein kinase